MDLAINSTSFADVPFVNLRTSHVQSWVKAMQDKPLEPSTIHTRFVNVRGVIRAAVNDRYLVRDITVKVKLPRRRKAEAAMRIPPPAEVAGIFKRPTKNSSRSSRCVRSRVSASARRQPHSSEILTSCAKRFTSIGKSSA